MTTDDSDRNSEGHTLVNGIDLRSIYSRFTASSVCERNTGKSLVVLMIFVLVFAPAVPTITHGSTTDNAVQATGATEISSCTVINSSGTFVLTSDIVNSSTETCIQVLADNVTIDGQGHTIDGGNDEGNGIMAGIEKENFEVANVSVSNLTAVNWGTAIKFVMVNSGSVKNNTLTDNRRGFTTSTQGQGSQDLIVSGNYASENSISIGIFFTTTSTVVDNTVRSSGNGILVSDSNVITIEDNSVSGGRNGIRLANTISSGVNSVVNNEIRENNGSGIDFFSSNGYVLNNTIQSNNQGIITLYSPTIIRKNIVIGNKKEGVIIRKPVEMEGYNTIADNVVNQNGIGISAGAPQKITDNTAINNSEWDYLSAIDTTVTNLTLSSATISFTGNALAIKGVDDPPADPSSGETNIQQYVNVTNSSTLGTAPTETAWIDLNVSYSEADLQAGNIKEDSLRMWRYDGSWAEVPGRNGVDTERNVVFANASEFGVLAPLGEASTSNDPPIARFDYEPKNPAVGQSVLFNASQSSDPEGSSIGFEWDLDGDGEFEASGVRVTRNFSEPGAHNVTLRVTDFEGATNTTSKTLSVSNSPPQIKEVDQQPKVPNHTESVTVTAVVNDPDDNLETVLLNYSINGGPWLTKTMESKDSETFVGSIPVQDIGNKVDYHIFAIDTRGASNISEVENYYSFEKVKEVAVVFGNFSNHTEQNQIPQNKGKDLEKYGKLKQEKINEYYGSKRGSMGAVGFNMSFYDNNGEWYQIDNSEEYNWSSLGGLSDGRGVFVADTVSAVVDSDTAFEPYRYDSIIAVSPGDAGIYDSNSSPFDNFDTARAYMLTNRVYLNEGDDASPVWIHELGHTLGANDLYNSNQTPGGDIDMLGIMGGWRAQAISPPARFSAVGRTQYNNLGWLNINSVSSNGTYEVQALSSKEVNDEVLNYNARSGWLTSDLNFVLGARGSDRPMRFEDRLLERGVYIYQVFDPLNPFGRRTIDFINSGSERNKPWDDPTLESRNDSVSSLAPDDFVRFSLDSQENQGENYNATVRIEDPTNAASNTKVASLMSALPSFSPSLEERPNSTSPDIDLHAYDTEGRHVGRNYTTGEYEMEIPDAQTSGDNAGGLEWIAVPENVSVRFTVSSQDIQEWADSVDQSVVNVTATYQSTITRYGDNPHSVIQDGERKITDSVTTVSNVQSIAPGKESTTSVGASIDFDPATISKPSKGKFVTSSIQLPEGFGVEQTGEDATTFDSEIDGTLTEDQQASVKELTTHTKENLATAAIKIVATDGTVEVETEGYIDDEQNRTIETLVTQLEEAGTTADITIEKDVDWDKFETTVNISSVKLNGEVEAIDERYGFATDPEVHDRDGDGLPEVTAKFDRDTVADVLESGENVRVTITGKTMTNTLFSGSDRIRVQEGKKGGRPKMTVVPTR